MKAVVISEHGGGEALRLVLRPDPVPGPDEALVRVRACSLNHLDVWVRRGVPGHRFPLPIIPGCDVAGELVSGGPEGLPAGTSVVVAPFTSCGTCAACVSGNEVGCREYHILGESRDGGCAEFVTVPSRFVFPLPAGLGFPEAASLLLAPLTAYHMVVSRAAVGPGESVLVTAAAGGVGSAAVQIAASRGGRVIGVVGSEAKIEAVRSFGAADVVVVPPGADLAERVRATLGKASFAVVVDSVGGAFFEAGVRLLRPFGRLVTCGATADGVAQIDLRRLFFLSLSLLGSTMGNRSELVEVLRMAADGRLKPRVHAVLPLERIAEAHRILEERQVIGKVVVTP